MQNEIDIDKHRFANETETDSGKIYERPENGTFEVYYENGQLRYQWDYKDGERADGESKGWWPDGSLKQIRTFKNGKLSEFLNQIPIEKIVLETDSPYLAPVPFRGKRNESSYIEIVAKKVSEIYDTDIDYVSEVTDKNALDIFGN